MEELSANTIAVITKNVAGRFQGRGPTIENNINYFLGIEFRGKISGILALLNWLTFYT